MLLTRVCVFACAEKQTGKQVQPVFISVDPARDTVSQVKQYVKGGWWVVAYQRNCRIIQLFLYCQSP
jgi:hypothetical protein